MHQLFVVGLSVCHLFLYFIFCLLYDILDKYVHNNDIHKTGTLYWPQVHNHHLKNTRCFFTFVIKNLNLYFAFSIKSTRFVINVLTYLYSLCLNLLTGSVTKFLYHHHKISSQINLRCIWSYILNR